MDVHSVSAAASVALTARALALNMATQRVLFRTYLDSFITKRVTFWGKLHIAV